ncbi:MAG: amidase family protein, partial [Petrimonas sp.]|nr:amidase family protein [Petrimonas sp.]
MKNLFFALFLVVLIGCNKPIEQKTKIDLEEITIHDLQEGYKTGKFTISEVTQAYLDRIDEIDVNGPALNSVIMVNPDAMQIAAQLDEELKQGKSRGPLHGIPVLLKDNIDTHDKMPNTAGSVIMKNSFPPKDAWITAKLREAGAVIIGKTNLSEWANFHSSYSSSGWSALGGQTKNPYDLTRNPCGSSSGSGVAVSANLTVLAIGTETDGSIVCPANNNGIVGIKPTVGLLSRSGIIPISFTQDTPGPMARTVSDAAICLGVMTGVDTTDTKTIGSEGKSLTDYTPFLKTDGLKGKRIGFDTSSFGRNFHLDKVMQEAVDFIKNQGAEIVEVKNIIAPNVEANEFQAMLYEFKDGLNKYFATLGPNAAVKSVEELIGLQKADSAEMEWFNHHLFDLAQEKGPLDSPEYKKLLAE